MAKKQSQKKTSRFSITDMLQEIYAGLDNQQDREFIRITVREYFRKHPIMPNNDEVESWFSDNIGKGCSASSGIFKFRQYLRTRIKK